jgi:hypothetical protein
VERPVTPPQPAGHWQASPRVELGLRLENLSDENYREHGSGVDAAGRNLGFWFNALF